LKTQEKGLHLKREETTPGGPGEKRRSSIGSNAIRKTGGTWVSQGGLQREKVDVGKKKERKEGVAHIKRQKEGSGSSGTGGGAKGWRKGARLPSYIRNKRNLKEGLGGKEKKSTKKGEKMGVSSEEKPRTRELETGTREKTKQPQKCITETKKKGKRKIRD